MHGAEGCDNGNPESMGRLGDVTLSSPVRVPTRREHQRSCVNKRAKNTGRTTLWPLRTGGASSMEFQLCLGMKGFPIHRQPTRASPPGGQAFACDDCRAPGLAWLCDGPPPRHAHTPGFSRPSSCRDGAEEVWTTCGKSNHVVEGPALTSFDFSPCGHLAIALPETPRGLLGGRCPS